MSRVPDCEGSAFELCADFDAEWYVERYPDVALSGLDPADHYRWLGQRLGRQPRAPVKDGAPKVGSTRSAATASRRDCDNVAIGNALRSLCEWLFPRGHRPDFMDSHWYQSLGNHFWNDESNGRIAVNPNGKALVDFTRDLDPAGTRAKQPRQRKRLKPKRILLASYYAPSRAHAGGLRILDLYEEIRARNPSVHLALFSCSHPKVDGDISSLGNLFDDLYFCEPHEFGPETLQRLRNDLRQYDLVDLQFHQAGLEAPGFRQFGRSLIYTPMEALSRIDFHLVREAAAKGHFALDKFFSLIHRGAEEHRIMQSVDSTVCVSDADADFLLNFSGGAEVTYFPTGLSKIEFAPQLRPNYKPAPIGTRKNRLVFAAYFGSETNSAGLEWYLREVHPQVLAACPNYNLAVVGRGDTSKLEALDAHSVSFIGEAPSLSPVLEQCKGGLVLALHGSGFRGKINQYALCGLPTVSTSLGVTGLSYRDGKDILIGDGPAAFAAKCIALLTREKDAQRIARAARKRALDCYSWSAIWPQIAPIYGLA